ncbi:glycosyltransferase family 4 protein [Lichenicoccus sp.]|uniref:glycosyltransferase family 4 protein n=1 Tax=Lichenicoccus sp. TaxID=2781899 RepID=UPI003D0EA172
MKPTCGEIGFAVPGPLATRTGGYGYDRRLIAALRQRGLPVRHLQWPSAFPAPDARALASVARSLAAWPDGSVVLVDGLAFGAMPEQAAAEALRLRLVALVHHPLALETGAPAGLRASERAALSRARAVIATSATTAETLGRDYGVPADRLLVAPPGTDPAPAAPASGRPPELLCVGAVTPRKGHDVLVAALAAVADLAWRCTVAGDLARAPAFVRAVEAQIAAAGLAGRIRLAGEVPDVGLLYRRADLFVLASRHEGYGMAFAEALAHGLPVIGTRAGAIPALVPEAAGALVPPDDPAALAQALRWLLADPEARRRGACMARAAGQALPGWDVAADRIEALLRRLKAWS